MTEGTEQNGGFLLSGAGREEAIALLKSQRKGSPSVRQEITKATEKPNHIARNVGELIDVLAKYPRQATFITLGEYYSDYIDIAGVASVDLE